MTYEAIIEVADKVLRSRFIFNDEIEMIQKALEKLYIYRENEFHDNSSPLINRYFLNCLTSIYEKIK